MKYDVLDFKADQDKFNIIAGTHDKVSYKDMIIQMNIVDEEINEIWEGLENKDLVEVLDGAIDSLYTVLGIIQKLENKGLDVQAAMYKVASDNLKKFHDTKEDAEMTVDFYENKNVKTSITHDTIFNKYVVRNAFGKVMKPWNFVPTDLTVFVDADVAKEFVNESCY